MKIINRKLIHNQKAYCLKNINTDIEPVILSVGTKLGMKNLSV